MLTLASLALLPSLALALNLADPRPAAQLTFQSHPSTDEPAYLSDYSQFVSQLASDSDNRKITYHGFLEEAGRLAHSVADRSSLLEAMEMIGDVTYEAHLAAQKPRKAFVHTAEEKAKLAEGFEVVTSSELPDHRMRIKSSQLCDSTVKQYSGYLDSGDKKHLFFWFFESRSKPSEDPLLLWMNGGPGCSSTTGLLFELGPCNIEAGGNTTEPNKYGWNSFANTLFLDQPVGVGYSYSEGDQVNNSQDAAKDVYAFLQLFYQKFPQYGKAPFTMAAESYGGTYVPNFASYLFEQNAQLASARAAGVSTSAVHIPLATLMIGNGLTEPRTQFATIPDYACKPSKYAIFDDATCRNIRSKLPTCQRLQTACYNNPSRFTCVPAGLYCWGNVAGAIGDVNKNPYDIRKACDRSPDKDGPLCYKQMGWIETFMNRPDVRKELGAPDNIQFESCNMQVNRAFQLAGDGSRNSAELLPPLLEGGVRVLVYAGEMDYMCEFLGNKAWPANLESKFQADYKKAADLDWVTAEGKKAGLVRTVGKGAGNLTFIQVFEAGHMVPFDQPEASLDMLKKWLANEPFAKQQSLKTKKLRWGGWARP